MVFDRRTLVIPDNTVFDEKAIISSGDVIIGDRCLVQFGIRTDGRVFIGEHAIIDGDIDSAGDVRVDIFSRIRGNVKSHANVYLGEKVTVDGRLSVACDLDVGDSVEVKEGFEAKGWINIRSPIPIVIYIFIYLSQLLKMGHSEEIERILEEMEDNEGDTIPISEIFLFIPSSSMIGLQSSQTDGDIRIGKNCKLRGTIEVKGKAFIGDNTNIHGGINADSEIYCGKNVDVKGAIKTAGSIRIDEATRIGSDITAQKIHISKSAITNGTLYAKQGITFIAPYDVQEDEDERRFEEDIEVVDVLDDEVG